MNEQQWSNKWTHKVIYYIWCNIDLIRANSKSTAWLGFITYFTYNPYEITFIQLQEVMYTEVYIYLQSF